jgi:hypothetical protein
LQYNFNWDKMSAVAGLTFHNCKRLSNPS